MDTFIEAASLIGDVDKKLMVLLRDGRVLIGILRTVDQFANLVLHRTNERIHVGQEYGDINRGVIVVRGENVVLYGVVDKEMENNLPFKKVSVDEILDAQRKEIEAKKEKDTLRAKALKERDISHDDFF